MHTHLHIALEIKNTVFIMTHKQCPAYFGPCIYLQFFLSLKLLVMLIIFQFLKTFKSPSGSWAHVSFVQNYFPFSLHLLDPNPKITSLGKPSLNPPPTPAPLPAGHFPFLYSFMILCILPLQNLQVVFFFFYLFKNLLG